MNMLSKEIIESVSIETEIAPAYIEKDWYLISVLSLLEKVDLYGGNIIFAGGTSLSKAYKLINRFSEDIDFIISHVDHENRTKRGKIRDNLIEKINQTGFLKVLEDTVKSRDENKFISFYVEYPKIMDPTFSLRNNIKIEISFINSYLDPNPILIKSFVGELIQNCPEAYVNCVSPIETAANKFNALMWRIDVKDRSQPLNHMTNDPTLIRHLHDLSAMYHLIEVSNEFIPLVKMIFQKDVLRGNKNREISLVDFSNLTFQKLKNDSIFKEEYEQFVTTMCYETVQISFEQALSDFEKICLMIRKTIKS